jgi:YidC/Oxa1 family membrane protein insertase
VPAGQEVTFETALWAGPKDQYRLEAISPDLGLTIDYGMLWFVGYPIFWLLTQINDLVGNYGVAIVLLTCVIRLLFYPLSKKQFRSQLAMKRLQPKLAQLKERYGDDKQRFVQAQMELWKKEGVNPFSGCLPVLLQMPVFLGIYWVLNESVELRQAPFFLWYHDLSMPDPYFVLPLLLGAAYFLQQHLTPMMTTDPMQAKVMKFMPVMFCAFFLFFPAGLVLYYLANALLSITQQWYFNFTAGKETLPANDS